MTRDLIDPKGNALAVRNGHADLGADRPTRNGFVPCRTHQPPRAHGITAFDIEIDMSALIHLGGDGTSCRAGLGVSGLLGEAKVLTLVEGTSEIQALLLRARYVGILRASTLMRSVTNRGTAEGGPAISPMACGRLPQRHRAERNRGPTGSPTLRTAQLDELNVTLELSPGSLWSEAMLSERIGIERKPVREAVQRLHGRSWLVIRRHRIRISDIDPHEQMLVLELRREFEPLVASRAARRATVDERRYLSKIADSFMEAGATVDVMKFLRVHFESKAS